MLSEVIETISITYNAEIPIHLSNYYINSALTIYVVKSLIFRKSYEKREGTFGKYYNIREGTL